VAENWIVFPVKGAEGVDVARAHLRACLNFGNDLFGLLAM
jgi:hypothetical protein